MIKRLGEKPGMGIVNVNDDARNLRYIKFVKQFQSLVATKYLIYIRDTSYNQILDETIFDLPPIAIPVVSSLL
jgi:hypothetical protein